MNVGNYMSNLPPRESAELHIALAHAIITLYRSQLLCHGTDAAKHPISLEMERLNSYVKKLSSQDGTRPRVDQNSAQRLVANSISQKH